MTQNSEAATSRHDGKQEEVFSLKEYFAAAKRIWYWFVISVFVFLTLGVVYLLRQQPVYERSMEILIKDQDGGGGIGDISSAFASMGLVSSNTSVYNELITLKSPAVMAEVVKRLHLEMNYSRKGRLHWETLYGDNQPIVVAMPSLGEQQGGGFKITINPDGTCDLSDFYHYVNGEKVEYDKEIPLKGLDVTVNSPIGKIFIARNPQFKGAPYSEPEKLKIYKGGLQNTVELYSAKLKGDLVDQDAEVIGLSIKDVSVQRAVDVLNTVVDVYNTDWVEDKNKLAIATSSFIDERLKLIEQELGLVDDDIADYKMRTMTPDPLTTAMTVMEESKELTSGMLEVSNKIAMAAYLKQYLSNPEHQFSIVPVNAGTGSDALEKLIAEYNKMLLARNSLVANSSDQNPIVADYDKQLMGMRENIDRTLRSDIGSLESVLKNMQGAQGKNDNKIRESPGLAKDLRAKERQQTVKESLYLYLLQKREENELSQTFTAYNTRIITPPTGQLDPISPKKKLILAIAFFLGLAIPAVLLYIIESSDNKVRARKDLDSLPMPFAGEIPRVGKKKKLKTNADATRRSKKPESAPLAVVEEGKRDVVNEAFRVVRSNLDFMIGKEKGCHVIMMTSFNPGSGKSFISYNLGLSFALKGKKVLLIDGDMRHGSTSMYVGSPSKGMSTYLREATDDWQSLVKQSAGSPNVYILPVGQLPPNPAELLEGARFGELIRQARDIYDYVIVDCPPVNIVVDTQIIEEHTDRTVFVVRAGLLDKGALVELNEFYHEKRFKHLSVILNGTDSAHSRYYTYGNYQSLENNR